MVVGIIGFKEAGVWELSSQSLPQGCDSSGIMQQHMSSVPSADHRRSRSFIFLSSGGVLDLRFSVRVCSLSLAGFLPFWPPEQSCWILRIAKRQDTLDTQSCSFLQFVY